jgi:hypothetical protein
MEESVPRRGGFRTSFWGSGELLLAVWAVMERLSNLFVGVVGGGDPLNTQENVHPDNWFCENRLAGISRGHVLQTLNSGSVVESLDKSPPITLF